MSAAAAVNACDAEVQPNGWPIKQPDLAALKDLGLSDRQIASYYRVRQDEVATLRTCYGLGEGGVLARDAPPDTAPAKRRRFPWQRKA